MADDESETPVAPQQLEIIEPVNVQTVFVDWVVTAGLVEGVVNVTFGTVEFAVPGSASRVVVASRLRLSREMGGRLHGMLGRMLGVEPENAPRSTEPPPIPRNSLN